ncbi:MerR family transcriptional regulator [Mycobacterium sp. CBMA271]|uniref:MerR family transcriptional regulator n=1 Tax=unclassified Mycobacteroides TaxID=2618759 RepID=UPI0012DC15F4|nr:MULTISPECIES: MerR family transcriptional regulator [unclassified Mycobacteroides]MUM19431.1 MerR family transcriptional regulator [Mycobacteroides sp. CBMA 326]MUM21401.1 MerR family transcriptional regulator [Mycobacteroides sp. CBMA 271]
MTEYRIDDLAQASGTTTRNIRGYQERGLLPRPLRRGRTAIYNDWHLRQLRAINRLLNEGFTVKHITKFLTGLQRGAQLADVLDLSDLEGLLEQRWSNAAQGNLSKRELEELLGPIDPATLARLVDAGLIQPVDGSDSYLVNDLDTIDTFAALISRGMELAKLVDIHVAMNEKLDHAARVLVGAAHDEVIRQRGPGWIPGTDDELAWATDLIGTMRRAATHSTRSAMNRALDDALRAEMELYRERAQLPADHPHSE